MKSVIRISTDSISLLVLYKAVIIFILSVIEASRSVIIEAFRDQFTATELRSYKEVFYDEATEERGMHNVIRTKWNVKSTERYLLHTYYTSELDNLHDDKEINQVELDWITWQRDYTLNKTWGDSRTSILEAMHVNCKF